MKKRFEINNSINTVAAVDNIFATNGIATMKEQDKKYFAKIKKMPIKDWHTIAKFHEIIKNYQKILRLENEYIKSNSR